MATFIGVALYLLLSTIAVINLLSSPYLRITSLGWFIAIWCLPFLGALLFMFTVVRVRKFSRNPAFKELAQPHIEKSKTILFERIGNHYEYLNYFGLEEFSILHDEAFVEDVLDMISKAKSRVWVATYIFSGDVKKQIVTALNDASSRGVDVRLLVDRFGSGLYLMPRWNPIGKPYAKFPVSVFYQSRLKSLLFIEKRLHSKIFIVDDVGIAGSHNLRDEVMRSHRERVRNVSIKFRGTVVNQLEALFSDLWYVNTEERIPTHPLTNMKVSPPFARIIHSDPIERSHNYNRYLTTLFNAARKRICIWMPYVIPTHAMRRTIISASMIGLDVRVLIPRKTESLLVDNAHDLVLKEFCDSGVACAISEGVFDHAKMLIIDDVTIIGSSNLDYRSLYRNYEANIEVYDEVFAKTHLSMFDQRFNEATRVTEYQTGKITHIKNQLTSLIAGLY